MIDRYMTYGQGDDVALVVDYDTETMLMTRIYYLNKTPYSALLTIWFTNGGAISRVLQPNPSGVDEHIAEGLRPSLAGVSRINVDHPTPQTQKGKSL